MGQIEVRRLQYRGARALTGQAEFAIGDALRTEVVDDGRLVLVRSLPLGRIALRGRSVAAATSAAWRNAIGMARHGGGSDAATANCVWFRDAAEARELLLRELASGRKPVAWFWPLAVPEWQQDTLEQYLERRFSHAFADHAPASLDMLIGEALAAGCADTLATVIAARLGMAAVRPSGAAAIPSLMRESDTPRGRQDGPADYQGGDAALRAAAAAVLERVPQALRSAMAQLAGAGRDAAFVNRLSRAIVLRAHPALAIDTRALEGVLAAVDDILRAGAGIAMPAPDPPARPDLPESYAPTQPNELTDEPAAAPEGEHAAPIRAKAQPAGADGRDLAMTSLPPRNGADPAIHRDEMCSAAAGLFLTIVPLIRLGWREWLSARPDLLVHQPGIRLLRGIAGHFHVPAADPIWSALAIDPDAPEPPAMLHDAISAWRSGLNGWLRRRARITLAETVLRRGWMLHGPTATTARFPMNGIDLRLRRLALDSDPGWVDWLGQSCHIVFRDRPLTGAA